MAGISNSCSKIQYLLYCVHYYWTWKQNVKGQTKSKWFFQADVSSPKNKQRNSILLLWDLFLFGFWRKLKTPNRHFEIKWPLEISRQEIELLFGVTIVLLYSSWEGPGSKLKCKKRKITVFIKFAVLILQNREIRPQDFGGSTASILPSNEANLRPQLWIYSKFSKALDRNCFLVYHETFFVVVLQKTAFNTICIAWNLCKKIKLDWH